MAKVNLLPIEIVENRRFRRTQILLGAIVAGVLLLAGVGVVLAQRGVDSANDSLLESQARVSTLQTEKTRYAEVPQVIAQVEAATTARTLAMGTDVLWYRYLNEIDGALPSGVQVDALALKSSSATPGAASDPLSDAGIGGVTMEGSAQQYGQISNLLEALDDITGLASPALTNASRSELKIAFGSTAVVDVDALSGRYNKKAG